MNKTSLCLGLCCPALFFTSTAIADKPPNVLLAAATQYENAVKNLDGVVSDAREIRRGDRGTVDRLQLAAKRMTQAARNPRHLNRLRFERKKVLPVQAEVETALFENYSPNIELARAWYYVVCAQAVFDEELAFYVENPRRAGTVQRRKSSPAPSRFLTLPRQYDLPPIQLPHNLQSPKLQPPIP